MSFDYKTQLLIDSGNKKPLTQLKEKMLLSTKAHLSIVDKSYKNMYRIKALCLSIHFIRHFIGVIGWMYTKAKLRRLGPFIYTHAAYTFVNFVLIQNWSPIWVKIISPQEISGWIWSHKNEYALLKSTKVLKVTLKPISCIFGFIYYRRFEHFIVARHSNIQSIKLPNQNEFDLKITAAKTAWLQSAYRRHQKADWPNLPMCN